MNISDLPIPDIVKEKLMEEGITKLYPPQIQAIDKGLLKGNNLVVAIPTASGKTLVAIIACIKNLTDTGLKTLYLSPLRALAYEKYVEFKNYLDPLNKRTILLTGDYDAEDTSAKYADVIIATNEKIDSAIRHQANWLNKIGLIVSDEIHLINDSSRGPTLEVVLALLRKVTDAQLLALSATIHNADQIARWLEAELVSSDWRPVELKEGVLYDKTIVYGDGTELTIPLKYKDSFNNLVSYILSKKNQALIFVTTRNMAESTAKKLASSVGKTLTKQDLEKLNLASSEILSTGEQTKQSRGLAQLIRQGVSYHHAGLNSSQRRIVEKNFIKGNIKILSATPTLAAGIYRYDVTLGSYPIPVLEYKQQAGRAGRPQFDNQGDAILIAKNEYDATSLYQTYITADTEDIESRIATEPALRKIVLGQIATENTQTMDELQDFIGQTFYGYQQDSASLSSILKDVIKFLRKEGLISIDPDYLIATGFGKRVSQLYIDPLSAIVIRDGLVNANVKAKNFLTDISYLHLVCSTPDVRWITIRKDEQIDVINYITNHEEEFLTEAPQTSFDLELFMSRVKTSLILQDWIKETPEEIILDRYNVGSGDIYMVVSNAEWLLYAASELAKLLNYNEISTSISALHNRVVNGIKSELLDLVAIPNIGRVRARILYDKGFTSRQILKQTDPNKIIKIPGFGKELVKNIYTHLLGDNFNMKDLRDSSSDNAEDPDKNLSIPQKQLDDFFS